MRLPASSACVIASRIIFTAYSASFATSCEYRWARRAISSDLVMPPIPFVPSSLCLLLRVAAALVELRAQQRAKVGGAGARRRVFRAQLLHRLGLLGQILRLHREVDRAVLAIDVDDHRIHLVAFLQVRAQVLDAVARELGGAQIAFGAADIHHRTLGVD